MHTHSEAYKPGLVWCEKLKVIGRNNEHKTQSKNTINGTEEKTYDMATSVNADVTSMCLMHGNLISHWRQYRSFSEEVAEGFRGSLVKVEISRGCLKLSSIFPRVLCLSTVSRLQSSQDLDFRIDCRIKRSF